jgi:hypothetical protein
VEAKIRLQLRRFHLGDHFAVPLRIEAVDHHPIKAGELRDRLGGSIAERRQISCRLQPRYAPGERVMQPQELRFPGRH